MLEDRRLAVLRAIVEDYVSSREPVGSKALVERHAVGVSSASIRTTCCALWCPKWSVLRSSRRR